MNPAGRNVSDGSSTARIAIIVALVVFIAGGFVACHCPEFFVVMGLCSLVALGTGSHRQRWIALVLLGVAIAGFVIEFRGGARRANAYRRVNTMSQLSSLNSLLVSMQISESGSNGISDTELVRCLRANDHIKSILPRGDSSMDLSDFWNRPLFLEKRADGYRVLRSTGPDGRVGTDDDL